MKDYLTAWLKKLDAVETMPHLSIMKASNGWACSIRDMGNNAGPLIQVLGKDAEDAQIKGIREYFDRKDMDSLI